MLARALEVLFILHADHEQNCSTSTMRAVGSSRPIRMPPPPPPLPRFPARCTAAPTKKCCACWRRSASKDNIPGFIEQVKEGKRKLMGFGHRVYKNYDPRARIIKKVADEVFEVTGRNPKIDIALELERIAL